MVNYRKRLISVILAVVVMMTAAVPSFALSREEVWENIWSQESENGVILFPGSNNSEMNITWYSKTESEPKVLVTEDNFDNAVTFTGFSVAAPDGDYSNKVTVTGLEPGKTYKYKCISEGFESNVYFFETDENEDEFSAVYMTDIHISYHTEDPTHIKETSRKFNSLLDEAVLKSGASILLSTGDQATEGMEAEYKGLASATALKMIPIATTIGNHDRKHIAYKTFNHVPNEDENSMVSSYIGSNYWFTKGDVLFLVMDSNNASGMDHRRFVKEAIKANPNAKWKVMMAHHDLYSGRIPHRESENELLRLLWAPIADEFKIDLVLLGHSHYYTVSNVMYNNQPVEPYAEKMSNPKGTVYMVSGSINRPRDDDDIGLNTDWIGYANTPDDQAIYNVLDFTSGSITVSSYYQGRDEAFNSFTIEKGTAQGGHPNALPPIYNSFIRFVGTVYALFNNIGVYNDLKEDGIVIDSLFEAIFG